MVMRVAMVGEERLGAEQKKPFYTSQPQKV